MFEAIPSPAEDALHGVMARFAADPRDDKMDLGVGVYRNASGHSPIMRSVKAAETTLAQTGDSKAYLSLRGHMGFIDAMTALLAQAAGPLPQHASVQTVGGTGGVRLAVEMAKRANPGLTVHIGTPTWPNHFGICEVLDVPAQSFTYYDSIENRLCVDQIRAAIVRARPGDMIVLHGPCHNPTGEDLDDETLLELIREAATRGVVPLIDSAYYGLANPLDDDLALLVKMMRAAPEICIAMSGSKSFGLYRDRIGILFVRTSDETARHAVQKTLESIARATYSMPAAHGAEVIGHILSDETLAADWRAELSEMRARLYGLRCELVEKGGGHAAFSRVMAQKGIFSLLPLKPEHVSALAKRHAIYMPASGRINIAGLRDGDAARLVAAVGAMLD
ncbi:aromatic amino acid transaminase [Pacificimonas sp. WHA3]|uniref:Aromatic amino acid transaminase n=1 Tax=Pacificimonas pallii TaxID=2827236 RepID=A0ABS6SG04_9SPHN|nr:aromatic amino acid transaminase [Pacificimonas pallii]MBV7256983.1 aromatic amino acid transaminase [Pacificimonas pallii]